MSKAYVEGLEPAVVGMTARSGGAVDQSGGHGRGCKRLSAGARRGVPTSDSPAAEIAEEVKARVEELRLRKSKRRGRREAEMLGSSWRVKERARDVCCWVLYTLSQTGKWFVRV